MRSHLITLLIAVICGFIGGFGSQVFQSSPATTEGPIPETRGTRPSDQQEGSAAADVAFEIARMRDDIHSLTAQLNDVVKNQSANPKYLKDKGQAPADANELRASGSSNVENLAAAGVDPDTDLSTWQNVDAALTALKAGGEECPLVTAWQSWIHLENFSAYHDVPFASQDNGFAGLDTELMLNGEAQIAHLTAMGQWAQDGKFIYTGRRNEGGANFRSGECALFTESSAGYAGISSEAEFDFDVRPLPYWEGVGNAPLNTIIGGASLWVMEGHEDDEYKGAGQFLSFLSSSDVQAAWHQNTGYLPITAEAGDATRAAGFYEANPGTEVAVIQMTANEPTANSKGLRLGSFDQIRGIIDEELEGIWAGDKTAQEAMDSAKERGDALLRRFEAANR